MRELAPQEAAGPLCLKSFLVDMFLKNDAKGTNEPL
jgi:hypothetical protein